MHVGIVGSGPIAQGAAAILRERGHRALLWSPRGSLGPAGRRAIETTGLLRIRAEVDIASEAAALGDADAILFALRGNGHRAAMEAVAPHVRGNQALIVSAQLSLGGLYLARLLAQRNLQPLVVCWATTVTGGPVVDGRVAVRLLRDRLDVATIPAARVDEGTALSRELFGDRFSPSENVFATALSNLNPPIHMANAILNFTRIEYGEDWSNFGGISPAVGRLIEALDAERLALAARLGVSVRTVQQHYRKSFGDLPESDRVHDLARAVAERRRGTSPGPTTIETRFITEDVPFGIAFIVALGRLAGTATPVHAAGLTICDAMYGRRFADENDLLAALRLDSGTLEALAAEVSDSCRPAGASAPNS